ISPPVGERIAKLTAPPVKPAFEFAVSPVWLVVGTFDAIRSFSPKYCEKPMPDLVAGALADPAAGSTTATPSLPLLPLAVRLSRPLLKPTVAAPPKALVRSVANV